MRAAALRVNGDYGGEDTGERGFHVALVAFYTDAPIGFNIFAKIDGSN